MKDLKQKRMDLSLTQLDVAKKVGVSLVTYQLWEKEASTPNPENLEKLRIIFGKDTKISGVI